MERLNLTTKHPRHQERRSFEVASSRVLRLTASMEGQRVLVNDRDRKFRAAIPGKKIVSGSVIFVTRISGSSKCICTGTNSITTVETRRLHS